MSKKKSPTIRQSDDPAAQIPAEVLAQSIVDISNGMRRLIDGPLKAEAVALLIKAMCPEVSITQVRTVLVAIKELKDRYVDEEKLAKRSRTLLSMCEK